MYFSFIIPVYNVEKYLETTIESILNQTFKDFEIILVDDGSSDNSPEICDKFSKKYNFVNVLHKLNGGAADSRNVGLSLAKGEYIIFMDSDDFILKKSFLEDLHNKTKDKPDQVLFKYVKFFDDIKQFDKCTFSYKNAIEAKSFIAKIDALVKGDAFYGMAWIRTIKRSLLVDKNILFEKGLTGEDMDWNYKLLLNTKSIDFIDEPYIAYRQHSNSITQSYKIKNLVDFISILEKWAKNSTSFSKDLRLIVLGSLAKYYSNLLIIYSRIDDSKKKDYKNSIKNLDWLLNYGFSKRPKYIGKSIRYIGFDITIFILKIINKVR